MAAKIYLSYGMEYADDAESRGRSLFLRNELIKMGYQVFNPYTDEGQILGRHGILDSRELVQLKKNDLDRFLRIMADIRKADIDQLRDSDLVLAFLDKSARGGVVGEITVATYMGIPVYSILVKQDVPHISGWTLSCPDKIFLDIDTCLEYIKNNPVI